MSEIQSTFEPRISLVRALGEEIRRASAYGVLMSHAVADRAGVNASDLEVADLLGLHGPMSAGELARLTGYTTGAITGLVDRLERDGFARRVPDPSDRRRVIVEPASRRAADLAPLYAPLAERMDALLAGYTDEQLRTVLDLLRRATAVALDHIAYLRSSER